MSSELSAAILGGLIGGVLGVLGTLVTSYYGPRKIEEWREKRQEERLNGPRKLLLKKLLEDRRFGQAYEYILKSTNGRGRHSREAG